MSHDRQGLILATPACLFDVDGALPLQYRPLSAKKLQIKPWPYLRHCYKVQFGHIWKFQYFRLQQREE